MRVGLLTPSPLGAVLSVEGLLVSMQINATQIWRKRGSPGHLIHLLLNLQTGARICLRLGEGMGPRHGL